MCQITYIYCMKIDGHCDRVMLVLLEGLVSSGPLKESILIFSHVCVERDFCNLCFNFCLIQTKYIFFV